jgi:nitroreductase
MTTRQPASHSANYSLQSCLRLIEINGVPAYFVHISNAQLNGDNMDLREAIYGRRAVREFTKEPVDETIIRQLIEAAIQAPSAVNQQPWRFTVVRDKALLTSISCEAKAHMLRLSPAALGSHHFDDILSDAKFDIFYGAPVLIVISAGAGPWAIEDCALAAENMMLTAHASGLGTCWIGFAQGWFGTSEGKSVLKLPEIDVPVAPIIVGHPESVSPVVSRKPPRIDWVS